MIPLRGADGALTGAAGALLAPRLDAAARDLCTGQSALRALTAVGQVVLHDVVNNRFIGFNAENSIREFNLTDLLSSHIKNFSLHDLLSSLSGFLPKPSAGWYVRKPSAG